MLYNLVMTTSNEYAPRSLAISGEGTNSLCGPYPGSIVGINGMSECEYYVSTTFTLDLETTMFNMRIDPGTDASILRGAF